MAYCVVRTDLLAGIKNQAFLEHGRYQDSDGNYQEIQNGSIVAVGALEDGERESHIYTDVASDTTLTKVVLVANPELTYLYGYEHDALSDYTNVAGKCIRGYYLHGQSFSVTAEGFESVETAAVGDYVYVAEGAHIMTLSATEPDSGLVIGKLAEIEETKSTTFYCVEIAK